MVGSFGLFVRTEHVYCIHTAVSTAYLNSASSPSPPSHEELVQAVALGTISSDLNFSSLKLHCAYVSSDFGTTHVYFSPQPLRIAFAIPGAG